MKLVHLSVVPYKVSGMVSPTGEKVLNNLDPPDTVKRCSLKPPHLDDVKQPCINDVLCQQKEEHLFCLAAYKFKYDNYHELSSDIFH